MVYKVDFSCAEALHSLKQDWNFNYNRKKLTIYFLFLLNVIKAMNTLLFLCRFTLFSGVVEGINLFPRDNFTEVQNEIHAYL